MQGDKNIPPDVQIERDAVTIRCGGRETVVTKDGVRIKEQSKSRLDSEAKHGLSKLSNA